MSHKASNQVWGSTLSTTDLIVALALADICDDHGRGIYPSIAHAAWKSNLSERTVQRVISKFVKLGILEVVRGPGRSRPTEYRMMLDAITLKSEWQQPAAQSVEAEITSNEGSNRDSGRTGEPSQDDRPHTLDDGMAELRSREPGSRRPGSGKGDRLSPFTSEPGSGKGDSRGIKGDSRGIKGDAAMSPYPINRTNQRESSSLSDSIFRCPPGFEISDELRAEISRGLTLAKTEIDNEIRKFRIYPFERKVPDWSAKLCVWMARADEYKKKHGAMPAIPNASDHSFATELDPDAEMLCVDPPSGGETAKHYKKRIDVARCSLKQAVSLARQLGIDARSPGETLNQLNARVGTAQLDKLRAANA